MKSGRSHTVKHDVRGANGGSAACLGDKSHQKRITTVDNVMTTP
jgi:hypothetical protein